MPQARKAPAQPTTRKLYVSTETFSTDIDGATVSVRRGQVVAEGSPLLGTGYFRPATDADLMEQATMAPGEHRMVSW
jgi:hypothetical protein